MSFARSMQGQRGQWNRHEDVSLSAIAAKTSVVRCCWMLRIGSVAVSLLLLVTATLAQSEREPLRLITLDPGHFHAALFQREMLPGVSPQVQVYAPLGPDLTAHLNRIAQFNARAANPTAWQLEVHATPDFLDRMLRERRGDMVVLSGRNRDKIDSIDQIVRHHLHVLADKPWILTERQWPRLKEVLEAAENSRVAAYDAMTQRYEITCRLQQELVNDRDLFGEPLTGSIEQPAVEMQSVHYLLKEVAGVPSLRPTWFFDVVQQGEGLADVGTHLVDLVQWTLFPGQAIDCTNDLRVLRGARWPTVLSREQFRQVTGQTEFPEFLSASIQDGRLVYYANNAVTYTLRGIFARLEVRWDFAAIAPARDSEYAVFRGRNTRVEIRQGSEEHYQAEVYVVPQPDVDPSSVRQRLDRKIRQLQVSYPGLDFTPAGVGFRLTIPEAYRISHEEHFARLTRQFLEYVRDPRTIPTWEKANMLAKYFVTTRGVGLARTSPSPEPDRK